MSNLHRPASAVVEDVLLTKVQRSHVVIPDKERLVRITNYARAAMRPSNPRDLDFEIDREFLRCDDFIVDFIVDDLRFEGQRHIIFATQDQLRTLRNVKRWYLDGTFKVMDDIWKRQGQLFSIHGFLEREGQRQQFPLVYVMMSRKTKEDYVLVLKRILEELGTSSVEGFLLDFEKAAWLAIREVFPGVPIKGCVFHWTQALWRKVQQLGLSTTYRQRKGVYDYIRQLMALPFLPHNQIETAFRPLKALARGEKLVDFVNYIDIQWFRNSVFDVESWCVFKENVRTNNDVEGWHYRLNSKAGSGTSFYKLVPLLRREAELMSLAVNGGTLSRREKKKYCVVQSRLENLWDKYMAEDMSTGAFLKRCGAIYAVTESRELPE